MGTNYVPFYPSDWLAGTRGMSPHAVAVYITLIARMYEDQAPLHQDEKSLARYCGMTPGAFTKALSELVDDGKIQRTENGLWNSKVDEVLREIFQKSESARNSAKSRWNEKPNKNNSSSDANAKRTQSKRNAIQNQSHIEKKSPPTGGPKENTNRGTRLPDDWQPDDDDRAYALSKGLTAAQAITEAEKFRNYWHAKSGKDATKLDWPATWRNWVLRAIELQPKQARAGPDRGSRVTDYVARINEKYAT